MRYSGTDKEFLEGLASLLVEGEKMDVDGEPCLVLTESACVGLSQMLEQVAGRMKDDAGIVTA